jgi:hypothetical protein
MEASRVERGGYLSLNRLTPAEYMGMAAALVLVLSVFLPWFTTSDTNPNSVLAGKDGGESATAWDIFSTLKYLLLLAGIAPFLLAWIIARGHSLTWKPGEVTMIVGIIATVLILCNGIILGKPGDTVDLSFAYGYAVALIGAIGMFVAGYLRQSRYQTVKKPPGVL